MAAEKEIREKLLEQAIPSDYMREFYRSIDRSFTDFELAAMLWNSRMKQEERLRAIKELSEITEDSRLREQIENRLRYESEAYRVFADNEDGKYIYTVEYEDEEWSSGFFRKLDAAVAFAKKDGERGFSIEKQIIVEDEPPTSKAGWNPILFPELQDERLEYSANPDGEAGYSADGELRYWWSDEDCLPDEIKNLVDNWSAEHFENYPLLLENPFDKGDIVMDGDEIGVIDISKKDMESVNKRIRNGEVKYCDYLDSATTTVQYIGKDGRISHDHPPLLFLKKVSEEEVDPEIWTYAGIVSDMVQGKISLDFFLLEYEEKIKEGMGAQKTPLRFALVQEEKE